MPKLLAYSSSVAAAGRRTGMSSHVDASLNTSFAGKYDTAVSSDAEEDPHLKNDRRLVPGLRTGGSMRQYTSAIDDR